MGEGDSHRKYKPLQAVQPVVSALLQFKQVGGTRLAEDGSIIIKTARAQT